MRKIFKFLSEIKKNNSKDWMDAHKPLYQEVRAEVIDFVGDILKKSNEFDNRVADLLPKETLFRINRDIRFSKNKAPYKTNFGISIVEGGKKSGNPEYYINLEPNNCFVGGGIFQPSAEVLKKVRQEIDYNGKELIGIITDKTFKEFYGKPYGESLKTAPKGYPKEHEYIELLRLKRYVFIRNLDEKQLSREQLIDEAITSMKVLRPFLDFFKQNLE